MTPLVPLLETSDDELELALLRSAHDDEPPPAGLRDTALALGLSAVTAKVLADSIAASQALAHAAGSAQAAGAAHAASTSAAGALGASGGATTAVSVGSASMVTLTKFLAAGALLSFGAMAGVNHVLEPSGSAPPVAAQASKLSERSAPRAEVSPPQRAGNTPAPTEVESAPMAAPGPELAPRKAAISKHKPDTQPAPAPLVPPAPAAAPLAPPPAPSVAAATPAPPSNASLTAEIRLLDRTRAALAAGDKAAARRLLRTYAESRPSAILSQEANLLRVRLLLAEGDRRAASALARQIIAQHPEGNHVDSLRSLAAEP